MTSSPPSPRAMKRDGLLHAPWTQALPNLPLVDAEGKPSTQTDFSEPVNHQESPWGMAQFNFIYDRIQTARKSLKAQQEVIDKMETKMISVIEKRNEKEKDDKRIDDKNI